MPIDGREVGAEDLSLQVAKDTQPTNSAKHLHCIKTYSTILTYIAKHLHCKAPAKHQHQNLQVPNNALPPALHCSLPVALHYSCIALHYACIAKHVCCIELHRSAGAPALF